MKIDRLIGILSILLQNEKVTAPFLAEKFEVSRRTINRDIEDLCKAGIPVMTTQGVNGGISIMSGYKVDKTLLTGSEMQAILAGLRSLDSVSGNNYYAQLMEKLKTGASDDIGTNNSMLIDLASWYKGPLSHKIGVIQDAIAMKRHISFTYYGPKGESRRKIEPYYLVFQWSSWYVWGWCTDREDFRLFKLNRMDQLMALENRFPGREVPPPDLSDKKIFPAEIKVKALFDKDVKWRLIEEYGVYCFTEQPDGKLLFEWDFTYGDSILSWFLSFGDKALVLEPEDIRRKLAETAEAIVKKYKRK